MRELEMESVNNPTSEDNTENPAEDEEEDELDDEELDLGEEEFMKLVSQIDQINSALDTMEERTDSINSQLRQILLENQIARVELENCQKNQTSIPTDDKDEKV